MNIYEFGNSEPINIEQFCTAIGDVDSLDDKEKRKYVAELFYRLTKMDGLVDDAMDRYFLNDDEDVFLRRDAQSFPIFKNNVFFIRANIWPEINPRNKITKKEYETTFSYFVPHNHAFSFLTSCYFGPGYQTSVSHLEGSSLKEYDNLHTGQPVKYSDPKTYQLSSDNVFYYKSIEDIHMQLPPTSMCMTLNLIFSKDVKNVPQYIFDWNNQTLESRPANTAYESLSVVAQLIADKNELAETARGIANSVYVKSILREAGIL